jgi:hypothetical protein
MHVFVQVTEDDASSLKFHSTTPACGHQSLEYRRTQTKFHANPSSAAAAAAQLVPQITGAGGVADVACAAGAANWTSSGSRSGATDAAACNAARALAVGLLALLLRRQVVRLALLLRSLARGSGCLPAGAARGSGCNAAGPLAAPAAAAVRSRFLESACVPRPSCNTELCVNILRCPSLLTCSGSFGLMAQAARVASHGNQRPGASPGAGLV